MTRRERLADVLCLIFERALSAAATGRVPELEREVAQPMEVVAESAALCPSQRPDREGAPWFEVCETAARRGAVMQTLGPAFIPSGMSKFIIREERDSHE